MATDDKPVSTLSTPEQMLDLVLAQTLALNMNNAVSAQQNAYTLNTAIVGSLCTRIMTATIPKSLQAPGEQTV